MKSVGQRTIAREVGVSVFTVSAALRNDPRVNTATRLQVQKIATKMGYIPNGTLALVMAQTRKSGTSCFQSTLAYVDTSLPSMRNGPTLKAYKAGVIESAQKVGFGVNVFEINDRTKAPVTLERVLFSRGIRGAVIFWPYRQGLPFSWRDLWERRTCIFLAARPEFPSLPVAMSDHFYVGTLACQKAFQAGHRRVGVVLDEGLNTTTEGRFLGGVLSELHLTQPGVRPLIFRWKDSTAKFLHWYQSARPECIITMAYGVREALQESKIRVPKDVSLIHWDVNNAIDERLSGPAQDPRKTSAAAVDFLITQLQHSEVGIPQTQTCLLVEPEWRNGTTLAKRRRIL